MLMHQILQFSSQGLQVTCQLLLLPVLQFISPSHLAWCFLGGGSSCCRLLVLGVSRPSGLSAESFFNPFNTASHLFYQLPQLGWRWHICSGSGAAWRWRLSCPSLHKAQGKSSGVFLPVAAPITVLPPGKYKYRRRLVDEEWRFIAISVERLLKRPVRSTVPIFVLPVSNGCRLGLGCL